MASYYVNRNAQSTGEHEVHKENCSFLPDADNRIYLGECSNCLEALIKAQKHYSNIDGCKHCSSGCHKK